MQHYVIVKWKNGTRDLSREAGDALCAAARTVGITDTRVMLSAVEKPNRSDVMIRFSLTRDQLAAYAAAPAHAAWKEKYAPLMETKAVFDTED